MNLNEAKAHMMKSLEILNGNSDKVFESLSWSFRQACAFGMTDAMRESYRIRFEALAEITGISEYNYHC